MFAFALTSNLCSEATNRDSLSFGDLSLAAGVKLVCLIFSSNPMEDNNSGCLFCQANHKRQTKRTTSERQRIPICDFSRCRLNVRFCTQIQSLLCHFSQVLYFCSIRLWAKQNHSFIWENLRKKTGEIEYPAGYMQSYNYQGFFSNSPENHSLPANLQIFQHEILVLLQ